MSGDPVPFHHGYLQVDDLHSIYFEEYGAKDGKPGKSYLFLGGDDARANIST